MKLIVSSLLLPRTMLTTRSASARLIYRVSLSLRRSRAGQRMDQACASKMHKNQLVTIKCLKCHIDVIFLRKSKCKSNIRCKSW